MARIALDFRAIEDKAFPTYPNGRYKVRIDKVRQDVSKASSELVLKVEFEIIDGPSGGTEFTGKKLFGNYSLQQRAGFRVKRLLAACGIPEAEMNDFDDEALLGREIMVTVSTEKYNNKDQNRTGNEDPVDGTVVAPATAGGFPPPPNGFTVPPAGFVAGNTTWGSAPTPDAPQPPPAKPVT